MTLPPSSAVALPPLDGTTRGPWHAYYSVHGDPSVVTDPLRPAFTTVATVATSEADYGRANAALIAAAPAMARALRTVLFDHCERVEGGHSGHRPVHTGFCDECAQPWPCGTYQAVEKALRPPSDAPLSASTAQAGERDA